MDTDTTKPRGVLTPGQAALMDQISREYAAAEEHRYPTPRVVQQPDPMQLSLFDFNDAGEAVGWNGASL